jgi:hypothetical protein
MSADDGSPRAGPYSDGKSSTDASPQTLPGHNPALAKYNKLQLRPDTVVKPGLFMLYFGFLGTANWKRKVAGMITTRVENHYVLTARSPSQEELDAIVEHGSRGLYHARVGLPIGTLMGGAWTYFNVRSSPAWPRNPTPMAILNSMRQATAQASLKQVALQTTFRMIFATSFCSIVSSIYAAFVETKSTLADPRLERFIKETGKQNPEDIRKRKLQAASERLRITRTGEQDTGTQMKQAIGQPEGYVSGSYEQDPNDSYTSPNSYSEYDNSQTPQSGSNPNPDQSRKPVSNGGPVWARGRGTQPASEQKSALDFLEEDDASPTAPEYRNTNIDGSSNGSAWDRIRRQNTGGRSQPPQQHGVSQPSQNPYLNYSEYSRNDSRNDQERHESESRSEKDQAQADFDKMIDAERNVGSERSSWNRRWGS